MIDSKCRSLRPGMKVIIDNDPFIILENDYFSPGKGKPVNRLKLKNLINEKIICKTMKSSDSLNFADVVDKDVRFLYYNNYKFYFIDINSFDEYILTEDKVGDKKNWLKEGLDCNLSLFNNVVIHLKLPKFVILKVVSTEDASKHFVISRNNKNSVLETGIIIKLPSFVKVNDLIKVDTETGDYVSRT